MRHVTGAAQNCSFQSTLQHSYSSAAQNFQGISQQGRITKYFTENELYLYHNQERPCFRDIFLDESFLKAFAKFPDVPKKEI